MSKAFSLALLENIKFLWRLTLSIPDANPLHFALRLILFPLLWLALFVLTLTHFFFFLLDEILFSKYRHVEISKPLFIVGIPRSGTTWLQRVLANDKNLTTLTLTECLFAPSITQRYLASALGILFKPLSKLLTKLNIQPLKRFDTIHKIRLSEPEEDFLLLLPLHACFLMILICPKQPHYWNLAQFDEQVKPQQKKIILDFYKRCLQKHLYFHGTNLTILSKNPSFTPFIRSLRETFRDANIVACVRTPNETVPSQLGSLEPAQSILGVGSSKKHFTDTMIATLLGYYEILHTHSADLTLIEMQDLQSDLEGIVNRLYASFGMALRPDFSEKMKNLSSKGKMYKSHHIYDLSAYGLTAEEIQAMFSPYWPVESSPS